jgi:hypothetical protein
MKMTQLKTLGFFIFLFLTACYGTVGENFDSSQINSIQNHLTTQEQIFERFGPPFKKGLENGQAMWTYQFDKWNALGSAQSKDLVILFDKKNIVKAYRFTTSNPKKP